jgi:peptide-methionine (S)-S-oxide reductase
VKSLLPFLRVLGLLWGSTLLSFPAQAATAVFGGGCFWCMEADFDKLPGVTDVVSGYSGGAEKNPSYEQVSAKRTGHIEVVRVTYDATRLSYDQLLDWYWHHVDPLTANGQFCDMGPQYRTVIFYGNEQEKAAAELSKSVLEKKLGKPFATEIRPAMSFWLAEDYHQNYAKDNPLRYNFYRNGCGRDARLKAVWGKDAPTH